MIKKAYYLVAQHYDTIGHGYNSREVVDCGETPAEAIITYRAYQKRTFDYGDSAYSISRPRMKFKYVDDNYVEPSLKRPTTVDEWKDLIRWTYNASCGLNRKHSWCEYKRMLGRLFNTNLMSATFWDVRELIFAEIEKLQ